MTTRLYRIGSVTVTSGSKIVTGSGTNWLNDISKPAVGDLFTVDMSRFYEITAIANNGQLTLFDNFSSSTQSGISYAIVRNSSANSQSQLISEITELVSSRQQYVDDFDKLCTSVENTITWTDRFGAQKQLTPYPKLVSDINAIKAQANSLVGSVVLPTKADFYAREQGKYAGSGFVEWGGNTLSTSSTDTTINPGMWVRDKDNLIANSVFLGRFYGSGEGTSATEYPLIHLAGSNCHLYQQATNYQNAIIYPPSPDGLDKLDGTGRFTSLAEAVTAGGDELSESSLMPRDFAYIRTPRNNKDDHNVSNTGYMFPNGNRQYKGSSLEGVSTDGTQTEHFYLAGVFSDDDITTGETISLSKLLANPKLMANPDNNLYADENGDIRQKDYSIKTRRTENNIGNNPSTFDVMTALGLNFDGNKNEYYRTENGIEYAIAPVCLVQRRNKGVWHPVYNSAGSSAAKNAEFQSVYTMEEKISAITSRPMCFAGPFAYTEENTEIGIYDVSGNIGYSGSYTGVGGSRPDDKRYDAIYASDVLDLRMSAHYVNYDMVNRVENVKNINATARGCEAQPFIKNSISVIPVAKGTNGSTIYIELPENSFGKLVGDYAGGKWNNSHGKMIDNNGNVFDISVMRDTDGFRFVYLHSKHGTDTGNISIAGECHIVGWDYLPYYQAEPTWTDIIASPSVLAATFPDGVAGSWIPVIPDGSTQECPLTKKGLLAYSYIATTNNGGSFSVSATFGNNFIGVDNSYSHSSLNESGRCSLVTYKSKADFLSPQYALPVLSETTSVRVSNNYRHNYGGILMQSTIAKIPTGNSYLGGWRGFINPIQTSYATGRVINHIGIDNKHHPHDLPGEVSPAIKHVSYVSEYQGQLYLQYLIKEIFYDEIDGFGDNDLFETTSGVGIKEDSNFNKVIFGYWGMPLPYWPNNKVS